MAISPALGRSFARKSTRTKSAGRIQCRLWLACFLVVCLATGQADAVINTFGNVLPYYPAYHPDPWDAGDELFIGKTADGGMMVANGSKVIDVDGHVSFLTGTTGSVTITGSGSTWENTDDLWLGSVYEGAVGSLTVFDGAAVYIGDAANNGKLGCLIVSDDDSSGSDAAQLYVYNGSTLNHYGYAVLGNHTDEYGGATIKGADSSWTNSEYLRVGYFGSGTLDVKNGATLSNTDAWLGYGENATGAVTVDGADSTWTNSEYLYVGNSGTGTLNIHNGGNVSSTDVWIGSIANGNGTVTVDGVGSNWTASPGSILVGAYGSGTLTVQNGGNVSSNSRLDIGLSGPGTMNIQSGATVSNNSGSVGYDPDTTGTVTVDGSESSWTNSSGLTVGFNGTGELTVQNAGSVSNTFGSIGYQTGSGTVTIDGAGSSWTNSERLSVGYHGSGTLDIQNGASVSNIDCRIGYSTGGTGTVTLTGGRSIWRNTGDLTLSHSSDGGVGHVITNSDDNVYVYVGDGSGMTSLLGSWLIVSDNDGSGTDGGHLYIYNGSTLSHGGNAMVAYWAGDFGFVRVNGTDSEWTNSGQLHIGHEGSGTVVVENGGYVSNTDGRIGCNNSAIGTVTVEGGNSTWECTGSLSLGNSTDSGSGTLTISNGGTVYVGDTASSGGMAGRLTVSDSDSTGTSGGYLYVYNGSTLTNDSDAILGDDAGEFGWAMVDGAGSSWTNNGELAVGLEGSGALTVQNGGSVSNNEYLYVGLSDSGILTVQNGGSITNADGLIGYAINATGTVTIDGIDSSWTNEGWLCVGYAGYGALTIQNGGSVSNTDAWIGGDDGGTGITSVDGADSSWSNSGDLCVGENGQGTLVIINDGLVSVAGTLTIDLNIDGDSYINMSTGGILALFGNADKLLTEFLALIDGTDAINYWDDTISDWADISGAMRYRDYTLSYLTEGDLSGYTLLTVRRAIAGDANGDGEVDVTDLGILATNYGIKSGAKWSNADLNGDGAVDVSDLGVLATHYGETALASVPEPSSLAGPLGLCLVGLLPRARRKR